MAIAIEAIRQLLSERDDAVEEAVLRIYERQTSDEQQSEVTTHRNGMGFNGIDAEILSSFAKQIIANKYGNPKGRRLSAKQMVIARRRIVKYVRQLQEVAEAKAARKEAAA